MQKWFVRTTSSTWNFKSKWPHWSEIAYFLSTFARSASAVTPMEKSSVNTNIYIFIHQTDSTKMKGSLLRAFQLAQDEHRTLALMPPKGLNKAVSKIWTISCDNSETVRDRMAVSINHNRKSHTGFRLVPTSMTSNDLELRNSPYFAFFPPNSIDLQADYVIVVEGRPIMSVKYCLPVPVFHFWPKLMHPAARSLCDSWASCFWFLIIV